jgi:transcription elongation factor GreA
VKTLNEYLSYIENESEEGPDTDYFREMLDYFVGFLRSQSTVNEFVVASNLVVRQVIEQYPYLNPGIDLDFRTLFNQIQNVEEVFSNIENTDLRKEFLHQVHRNVREWPEIYVRLFPHHLFREVIVELERAGHHEKIRELFQNLLHNYRDQREPFVWMVRNCLEDEWFEEASVDFEKILISMIHLLDVTAREIDNRKDVSVNRKLYKQIHNYLFKEGHVQKYIQEADEEALNRIYTLVSDVKDLDPSVVLELKHTILNRFPNFRFYGESETERVSRGFLATHKAYQEKQKQLQHIQDVEVPQNSREIHEAAQHGDLRENAEYKAAKERQEMLSNQAARLKDELERVQIVHSSDVDDSVISFGTKVTLLNLDNDKQEEYTVLGPWESDPDNRVISYLSPLGNELYNGEQGSELDFEINERRYRYKVEEISAVEI